MKHARLFIALLSTVALAIIAAPGVGAQSEPPTPTSTTTPAPPTRSMHVRLAYHAFIRSAPARSRGNDLGVVRKGTEVEVVGIVADPSLVLGGYWYEVRAPDDAGTIIDGWMHSTVVHLEPEQITALAGARVVEPSMIPSQVLPPATTTTAGGEQPSGGELAGVPTATPTATATPTPIPTAVGGPLVDVPLALRVCYDLHANRSCDVDEGIRGVLVYATDPETGQILGDTATDATGLARLVWRVGADVQRSATVTLSVPYFQEVRSVRASDPRAAPVIIRTLAPIPAWLP